MKRTQLYCPCGRPIVDSEIEYWNKENELGEPYCEVEAYCGCGQEFECSGWSELENMGEAKELLIEQTNLTSEV